jgi:general secretion pathway protein F/type IV pilus assembly protein PilC
MSTTGHGALARWYHALAQHLEAGLSLMDGLRAIEGPPLKDRQRMATALAAGRDLDSVLEDAPSWMSGTDRQLISAGHTSGKLPDTLRRMSAGHETRQRALRAAIGASVYPLVILHFAVFVLPAGQLMTGSFEDYLRSVLGLLLPLWIVLILVFTGIKLRFGLLAGLGDLLPGIRGYRRNGALRDVCLVLRAFLGAGCRLDEAWFGACSATGRKGFIKAGMVCAETVQAGSPPSGVLPALKVFPPDFVRLYRSGEETGQLDESLAVLEDEYGRRASASLAAASFWYPKLLFLVVAVFLAWQVVGFYAGYFEMIEDMIE